jgi:hypothetical protein
VTDQTNEPPIGGPPPLPGQPSSGPPLIPEPPDSAPLGVPAPGAGAPLGTGSAPGQLPTSGELPPPPPAGLPEPRKPSRGRTIGRRVGMVFLALVLLGGIGAIVRVVREATASPKDKAACIATADMIETEGQTLESGLQAWSAADDSKIRAEITNVRLAIQTRDVQLLDDAVNRVIKRCNAISSAFRSRFDKYCETHTGACKKSIGF